MRKTGLSQKQRLLEEYYQTLIEQIHLMEQNQKQVEQQMQEIEKVGSELHPEKIQEYLKILKKEYRSIRAGVFCNDWRVDALLYCQNEILQKKEIPFTCSMQGYDRGKIKEDDVAEVICQLLNIGVLENQCIEAEKRGIRLQVSAVQNLLIFSFFSSRGRKKRISGKFLRNIIKQYDGMMEIKRRPQEIGISLALRRM